MLRSILSRRALVLVLLGLALLRAAHPASADDTPSQTAWIIPADQARALLAKGALLFDTRSTLQRWEQPVEGAVPVAWQDFTQADPINRGHLLTDDALLTEKLRALGLSKDRPVIAIADNRHSWGEDGRMVWTLRTLGHQMAYLVDGGAEALLADGPVTAIPAPPGDFTVARTTAYEITKEDLAKSLGTTNLVVIDAREPREYAGATPYGESRGGHLPGAANIYYRDLLGPDGKLLPATALKAKLATLGVTDTSQVVAYCTGGIRSGFVTTVLQDAGIDARNYSGSMLEWSAGPPAQYPLVSD